MTMLTQCCVFCKKRIRRPKTGTHVHQLDHPSSSACFDQCLLREISLLAAGSAVIVPSWTLPLLLTMTLSALMKPCSIRSSLWMYWIPCTIWPETLGNCIKSCTITYFTEILALAEERNWNIRHLPLAARKISPCSKKYVPWVVDPKIRCQRSTSRPKYRPCYSRCDKHHNGRAYRFCPWPCSPKILLRSAKSAGRLWLRHKLSPSKAPQ